MIISTNDSFNKRNAKYQYNSNFTADTTDKLSVSQFKSRYGITSNNFIIQQRNSSANAWEYMDTFLGYVNYAVVDSSEPNVFKVYYNGTYLGRATYINAQTNSVLYYVCDLI